jgi:hypothetical protein
VAIEEVSPMVLAKELGVRPQQLYGLIRKHRINSWTNAAGKTVVGREEATSAIKNPLKRGPKSTKPGGTEADQEVPSPVRVGDVVTWRTQTGVRINQVKSQEAPFNYMQDLNGDQVFFRSHTLKKRLEEGVAHIERPVALLEMVAWQLQQDGKDEVASSLIGWIAAHDEELSRGHGRSVRPDGAAQSEAPQLVAAGVASPPRTVRRGRGT